MHILQSPAFLMTVPSPEAKKDAKTEIMQPDGDWKKLEETELADHMPPQRTDVANEQEMEWQQSLRWRQHIDSCLCVLIIAFSVPATSKDLGIHCNLLTTAVVT